MKKDYNKPKKIRTNYDKITELEAAYQQSLERIKYTEDKLERLWKKVGNVQEASQEATTEQEDAYNIELIYNADMATTKTFIGAPEYSTYISIYTANLDVSAYDLTKTSFHCTIETPNSLSYNEAGYVSFGQNWGYERIYKGTLYIKKNQYHNTNNSGNAHLKIWAITVL